MHRSCPQCAWLERERWLTRWKARLLPTSHYHIVFTLPHQYIPLWKLNRRAVADLLFQAARKSLEELLEDPKYLGAKPGILAALHTWNQKLQPHLHLHVLVTDGGLSGQSQWVMPVKRCLLPRKVLMIKFRGKFKALLMQRVAKGKLALLHGQTQSDIERLNSQLTKIPWNVKIHEPYPHGQGVVTYLAKYIKGGPIGNSRLVNAEEGEVTFRYRLSELEGGDGKARGKVTLTSDQFISRWLLHVPPKRLQVVRGYGLYSGNQHSRISIARKALGVPDAIEQPAEQWNWQDYCERAGYTDHCRCPMCGERLVSHRPFPPNRSPPVLLVGDVILRAEPHEVA
jgi:hypothetical protein